MRRGFLGTALCLVGVLSMACSSSSGRSGGGGDDDDDPTGSGSTGPGSGGTGGAAGAQYVCVFTLESGYHCSDGDSNSSPPKVYCRDDFESLEECESTVTGDVSVADGCTFETDAYDHQWLEGPCSQYTGSNPSGGSGGSGGQPSSGSGPDPTCDGTSSCDTCALCADAGPCAPLLAACEGNPQCVSVASCLSECTTDACVDACLSAHPAGVDPYVAWLSCVVCDVCWIDCDGASSCQ